MEQLKESQLIINPDGSIYHLKLRPEQIAETVILVGDPGRVKQVSGYFDHIEFEVENREMITHTGWLNNRRISVVSTGIGPDNIDIVLNELDALINVDFKSRMVKERTKKLSLIRIGTSGTIQNEIPVDSIGLTTDAIGFDNLARYYQMFDKINHYDVVRDFIKLTSWPEYLPEPYFVEGNKELISRFSDIEFQGFTLTAPGFYAPQGRQIRLAPADHDLNRRIRSFEYHDKKVINYEMESSALYSLSKMLGHEAVTVCAIIANRATETYSKKPLNTIRQLIEKVLERVSSTHE